MSAEFTQHDGDYNLAPPHVLFPNFYSEADYTIALPDGVQSFVEPSTPRYTQAEKTAPIAPGERVLTYSYRTKKLDVGDGREIPLSCLDFHRLTYLSTNLGPGQHPESELRGLLPRSMELSQLRKLRQLPEEVYSYEGWPLQITLGEVSLAASIQGAEELRTRNEHSTDLTQYNNMVIQKGDRKYHMPLDTVDALLAARVVTTLVDLAQANTSGEALKVVPKDITKAAWLAMSLEERALIVSHPAHDIMGDVYSDKSFTTGVTKILRNLTHKLTLTQQRSEDKFTVLTPLPEICYNKEPIDDTDIIEVIPDSRPQIAKSNGPLTDDETHMVNVILNVAEGDGHPVDQVLAVDMLDFVMSLHGKAALHSSDSLEGNVGDVVARIKERVRGTLGDEAYASAVRNRQVAGNRILKVDGRARQVGGRIPGDANWNLGEPWRGK